MTERSVLVSPTYELGVGSNPNLTFSGVWVLYQHLKVELICEHASQLTVGMHARAPFSAGCRHPIDSSQPPTRKKTEALNLAIYSLW